MLRTVFGFIVMLFKTFQTVMSIIVLCIVVGIGGSFGAEAGGVPGAIFGGILGLLFFFFGLPLLLGKEIARPSFSKSSSSTNSKLAMQRLDKLKRRMGSGGGSGANVQKIMSGKSSPVQSVISKLLNGEDITEKELLSVLQDKTLCSELLRALDELEKSL